MITKLLAMAKSAEGNGKYLWLSVAFVAEWIKGKFPNSNTGLKTTQMLHRNKACGSTYSTEMKALLWKFGIFLGRGSGQSGAMDPDTIGELHYSPSLTTLVECSSCSELMRSLAEPMSATGLMTPMVDRLRAVRTHSPLVLSMLLYSAVPNRSGSL